LFILTRGCDANAPRKTRTVFELKCASKFNTPEPAQIESFDESRDQSAKHEA
tara:strand:- start:156 stop:311 length:156 start_codon:yes stop_codon:yes gene_type:complete